VKRASTSRRIGPLPLIGGLQLDEPEGSPNGLLDALNFESRGGHLATRRGTAFVGVALSDAVPVEALSQSPADVTGQSVWYLGFDPPENDGFAEDDTIHFRLSHDSAATVEDDLVLTWEFYGEDDAWHALDVLHVTMESGQPPNAGQGGVYGVLDLDALIAVRMPRGWKTGQPTGLVALDAAKKWFRITRAAGVYANDQIGGGSRHPRHLVADKLVYAFTHRAGSMCIVASPAINPADTSGPQNWTFFVVDEYTDEHTSDAGPTSLGELRMMWRVNIAPGSVAANPDDRAAAIYVPATDEILFHIGGALFARDVADWREHEADPPEPFVPDHGADIVDTPYEDIAVEAELSPGAIFAIHAGHVYMGGFPSDPHGVRWSAGDEYWRVWPSENYETLASKGSGPLVGAAELAGALYFFTTTTIFRAQLVPAPEDSESGLDILYLDQVEETGCVAGRSIVACNGKLLFLAEDGVRAFDGTRSRVVTKPVRDLFRVGSEHPMAVRRGGNTVCAAFHPVENEYRLYYPRAGSRENDCMLVVCLDDGTCWLHGADDVAGIDTQGTTQPIGQRRRGVRAMGAAWHPGREAIVICDAAGVVGLQDSGERDIESKIEAFAETHAYGLGDSKEKWLRRVDVLAARDHLEAARFKLIPDGNLARVETRDVAMNPIENGFTQSAGVVQAGTSLGLVNKGYGPYVIRTCLKGRNFRVRLETKGTTHAPFRVAAIDLEVEVGGKR
jgi:hypothetical protein